MKQHVDITMKLSLWLNASLDEDRIASFVRKRLTASFREPMSHMLKPLTILAIRQEAAIYGNQIGPACFDGYEIHGVKRFGKGRAKHCEQVADFDAEFFSLFGHIPGQGLDCIGDFKTREHAEDIYARITGQPYSPKARKGVPS